MNNQATGLGSALVLCSACSQLLAWPPKENTIKRRRLDIVEMANTCAFCNALNSPPLKDVDLVDVKVDFEPSKHGLGMVSTRHIYDSGIVFGAPGGILVNTAIKREGT
jgi:hypothetical protein